MFNGNVKIIIYLIFVAIAFLCGKFQEKYSEKSAMVVELGKSIENFNISAKKIFNLNEGLNALSESLNELKKKDDEKIDDAISNVDDIVNRLHANDNNSGELQTSKSTCESEKRTISKLRGELSTALKQYGLEAKRANEVTLDLNLCINTLNAYESAVQQNN